MAQIYVFFYQRENTKPIAAIYMFENFNSRLDWFTQRTQHAKLLPIFFSMILAKHDPYKTRNFN